MAEHTWSEDERQHGQWLIETAACSYYAEVSPLPLQQQSALVEQLIEVAFGDLGARHLEVRVAKGWREQCCATC